MENQTRQFLPVHPSRPLVHLWVQLYMWCAVGLPMSPPRTHTVGFPSLCPVNTCSPEVWRSNTLGAALSGGRLLGDAGRRLPVSQQTILGGIFCHFSVSAHGMDPRVPTATSIMNTYMDFLFFLTIASSSLLLLASHSRINYRLPSLVVAVLSGKSSPEGSCVVVQHCPIEVPWEPCRQLDNFL